METLRTALDNYSFEALKQIGTALGVGGGLNKTSLGAALSKVIVDYASLPNLPQSLDPFQQMVLDLLLQNKGEMAIEDLLLPLVNSGVLSVEFAGDVGAQGFINRRLLPLLHLGLIFNFGEPRPGTNRRGFDYLHVVGIPPEVQKVLSRQHWKKSTEVAGSGKKPALPVVRLESGNGEQFLRRLFLIWSEIRRQPCKRLSSGGIGKRDLRRIAGGVGLTLEEHEDLISMLYEFLVAMDLLVIQGDLIAAADDRVGLRFWLQSLPEQMKTLLQAYVDANIFPHVDLDAIAQAGYYMYRYLEFSDFIEMREQLMALLGKMKLENWFSCDLFVTLANQGRTGGFLLSADFEQLLNVQWYNEQQRTGIRAKVWEAEFKAVIDLLRPLVLMGLLELGFGVADEERPIGVRFSALGRSVFGGEPFPPSEGGRGQVVLQPDFQVLALGPVPLADLAALERIAERIKFQDGVIEYHLTRPSIYAALRSGDSIGAVLAFLQKVTGQQLPQNVERTLQEWQGQYERLIFHHQVSILQVDREALLDELLAVEELRGLLHRLDGRTAWMRRADQAEVESRLWEKKLLPAFSAGPEQDLPRSMYWEEGSLRPRHPLPSLYSTGMVRRIAIEQPDGSWQLTAESVRMAIRAGMTAPEIVALIENLTGATLDAGWVRRLKLWSAHYGRAQTSRLMVMAFESDAALQELRGVDNRLRRWLHPLAGGADGQSLAFVEERHWSEVQLMLQELGVEITMGEWWRNS